MGVGGCQQLLTLLTVKSAAVVGMGGHRNRFPLFSLSPSSSKSPYPIIPNVDGYFLENSPEDLIMKGAFKHCPILIGFNEDEGTLTASLNIPGSETAKEPPHLQREHFQEVMNGLPVELGLNDR